MPITRPKSTSYKIASGVVMFTVALAALNLLLHLSQPVIIFAVIIKLLASTYKLVYLHERENHPHRKSEDNKALALIVTGVVGVFALIIVSLLALVVSVF